MIHRIVIVSAALLLASSAMVEGAEAPGSAPYGSATAGGYSDIEALKQLKAVYEFFFTDPASVAMVLNSIKALMISTAEYGPNDFEPLKVVVVSHGPELVVWDKKNYTKYKEVVDRAASMSGQGVRFEVCKNAAAALGLKPEDLHGFLHMIPSGPYALTYWQNKGFALLLGGTTQTTPFITPGNKSDVRPQVK